jgi:uncharacterized protein YggU (UPF0235/DUF167 family)
LSEAVRPGAPAGAAGHLPLTASTDGIIVTVRLTPRARITSIEGIVAGAGPRGTEPMLAVRVAASPVDGAANEALIRLLAKSWRLPPSSFVIAAGETGRVKRVLVRGEAGPLLSRITERIHEQ